MFRLFLAAITLLLIKPALAIGISEITVCWEEGLKPPYLMLNEQQKVTGIAVDMLNEILEHEKIKAINVLRPWKRCLEQIKTNEVTLVPNASFNEERAQFSHYTKPLYETHLVLFYRKDVFPEQPQVKTMESLSKYRVIGINGFNYQRYQKKIMIDTGALDRKAQFAMLVAGRGDFAAEQLEVHQYLDKQNKPRSLALDYIPDPAQGTQPFYILVSKAFLQGNELASLIDKGIDRWKAKGLDKKLVEKYLALPEE
ncbi:substrate-binding periplasmic protein [Roseateles koreensis]|uniref:Transporter substrate-binding domain-containing protein n=1 Tax=Roseateles koreensis TaxID=2987526 RepID=A0ABT5KN79_9BURK|nr:transporter substrate-binding domain-containing protein [Roseateles koreensis]MDC8783910.1 transporter substrate-binding domain-containing protein [Roseateles koreensis]